LFVEALHIFFETLIVFTLHPGFVLEELGLSLAHLEVSFYLEAVAELLELLLGLGELVLVDRRGETELGEFLNQNVVQVEAGVIFVVELARPVTLLLSLLDALSIRLDNALNSLQFTVFELLLNLLLVVCLSFALNIVSGSVSFLKVFAVTSAIVN
jgi:hypothetical protein